MSTLESRIRKDESRILLHLWGSIDAGDSLQQLILNPSKLRDPASHLKIMEMLRMVQTGLCVFLYWEGDDEHTLACPIEGYGYIDFEKIDGILDPKIEGYTGNLIIKMKNETKEPKHFMLQLELSKQRG